MRESIIEAYLVERVEELGGEVRKVKWIGRNKAPDRVVMLRQSTSVRGLTIWVELKATGKKPDDGQVREHNRMRRMGQRVEVIDSIEGVDELLNESKK